MAFQLQFTGRIEIYYESKNVSVNLSLKKLSSKRSAGLCLLIAGSLEAAYSLNWDAREIWGKGGGETLALL